MRSRNGSAYPPRIREAARRRGPGAYRSRSAVAATHAAGPIQFQNVAPACGLDFVLRNDAKGRKYQVETVLGGLGVIDFDQDGWPDLYCVNGASLPSLQKTDPRFSTACIATTVTALLPTSRKKLECRAMAMRWASPSATTTTTASRISTSSEYTVTRCTETMATALSPT